MTDTPPSVQRRTRWCQSDVLVELPDPPSLPQENALVPGTNGRGPYLVSWDRKSRDWRCECKAFSVNLGHRRCGTPIPFHCKHIRRIRNLPEFKHLTGARGIEAPLRNRK